MIRFGKLEDLEQVNIIRREVNDLHIKGEPKIFKQGFPKQMQDYVKEFVDSDKKYLIVSENVGEIDGFLMAESVVKPETVYRYELKFLEIKELGVLTKFQKNDIGKKLLDKAKEIAKNVGENNIILNMWTFNENALSFYEKYGFKTYRNYMKIDI